MIYLPVVPMNGINKDVCGAKLWPTTVSALSCGLWPFVPLTGHTLYTAVCVLMVALARLRFPTHPCYPPPTPTTLHPLPPSPIHPPPPPPIHPPTPLYVPSVILQSLWKVAQNPAVLAIASRNSYRTLAK